MPIENGEIVEIDADGVRLTDAEGRPVERAPEEVTWDAEAAEKGGYDLSALMALTNGGATLSPMSSTTRPSRSLMTRRVPLRPAS
jgi:glucosamine 6-phosphate synthetase-like amidotransferase/phosphosugar isomerase protein